MIKSFLYGKESICLKTKTYGNPGCPKTVKIKIYYQDKKWKMEDIEQFKDEELIALIRYKAKNML